jgi:cell division protein FtsB
VPSRNFQLNWFRLLLLIFGLGFTYLFIHQSCELWAIHQEAVASKLKFEQVKTVHQSLVEEKIRLNSLDYIEKIARDDLGLVKPGEVPYLSNNN